MIKKEPKVSIITINWNGEKDTNTLLNSLEKITYKNYNIILIDNNSSQKLSKRFIKKWNDKIKIIYNKKNSGVAEGTNIGIKEAMKNRSKYILAMNNDMIVHKNFLSILVEKMEENKKIAVSGPIIYYMKSKKVIWSAGCKYTIRGHYSLNQNEIDVGQIVSDKYVDACDTVLLMRSSVIKKIGNIDSDFFLVHEYTDWCLRARLNGYLCLFVPSSKVWHSVSGATKNIPKEDEKSINSMFLYYKIRNWLLTIKKNKNFFYYLFVLFLEVIPLAIIRFIKYIKTKQYYLIPIYYIAIWHAVIHKIPVAPYLYKK